LKKEMTKLKDVAALAGVSIATVSNVINETRRVSPATRARVERAASQLGYTPRNTAYREFILRGRVARPETHTAPARHAPARPQSVPVYEASRNGGGTNAQPNLMRSAGDFASSARAARVMLRLLRAAQPVSRAELARRLGLNRSTVTDTFKPLVASGVVLEESPQAPGVASRQTGRPAAGLSFNGARHLFVGVSLGVLRTHVGAADLSGATLAEEEFETPRESSEALKLVRAGVARLCRKSASGRELRVIAVSVPGPVDASRRRLLYAPHLGWHDVEVAERLRFNASGGLKTEGECVPVIVENDATAAAVCEAKVRLRGPDSELPNNFVLVRSGSGIGVGLVLGGEVYRGAGAGAGLAGEFGHMTIVAGGKPCVCGNRGCWERYASASAAASLYAGERAQFGGASPPRYSEIVARAEAGEVRAQRTLERVGEYLGIGIANVIVGLGVPRVVVSGRIVYGWRFISEPLRNAVAQGMAGRITGWSTGWSIEPGDPAGAALGAALEVAVDEFITSRLCA
jgi:predicted NBD/HSP70 family sugar kinase/transcriptional regulator with XRE-family HTH domain